MFCTSKFTEMCTEDCTSYNFSSGKTIKENEFNGTSEFFLEISSFFRHNVKEKIRVHTYSQAVMLL